MDFESQKSDREVIPLPVRVHLANASKTKFGHDSAFLLLRDHLGLIRDQLAAGKQEIADLKQKLEEADESNRQFQKAMADQECQIVSLRGHMTDPPDRDLEPVQRFAWPSIGKSKLPRNRLFR